MAAAVGVYERFYRLQAVRFSLFRHPPRGGSADATFPRWGKEGRTSSGFVGGGVLGAPYKEMLRIRPNASMWENPAAGRRGCRPLGGVSANSANVAALLRCCCGTGHGLDDVPYKALLLRR